MEDKKLDISEGKPQMCLRCNKEPALKDGSDEGFYYCKECIEIRARIDKNIVREKE